MFVKKALQDEPINMDISSPLAKRLHAAPRIPATCGTNPPKTVGAALCKAYICPFGMLEKSFTQTATDSIIGIPFTPVRVIIFPMPSFNPFHMGSNLTDWGLKLDISIDIAKQF